MSEKDFLTGCLSKAAIDSALNGIRARCSFNNTPFSILVIDLDHFKKYNDKYGHIEGDEILKYFSSTLHLSIRDEDGMIFRFGGDEFIVVFPEKTAEKAYSIAIDIINILKKRPFLSGGRMFKLSFSGGIASYPIDGDESDTILARADKAMYFSKIHGRGHVTLYRRIFLETLLRSLFMLICALILMGTIVYFQKSSFKEYVKYWLRLGMKSVETTLTSPPATTHPATTHPATTPPATTPPATTTSATTPPVTITHGRDFDIVYLKSGRVLKGIIKREDEHSIEISLNIDQGTGLATIQKSDIKNISNHQKDGESIKR